MKSRAIEKIDNFHQISRGIFADPMKFEDYFENQPFTAYFSSKHMKSYKILIPLLRSKIYFPNLKKYLIMVARICVETEWFQRKMAAFRWRMISTYVVEIGSNFADTTGTFPSIVVKNFGKIGQSTAA